MLTSATEAEFTAFQATYGYTVKSDAAPLLALSFALLQSLPWCEGKDEDHASINLAQCFIAWSMSPEGGGFNPAAQVDSLVVKREKVSSLEQEFMFNPNLGSGSSAIDQVKKFPIAYGLLSPFICEGEVVDAAKPIHKASVFVV